MNPDYPRRSLSSADTSTDSYSHAESSRKSYYGPRARQFVNRHGSKIHAYEPAKAPWPLSYDKATLELSVPRALSPFRV